MTDAGARAVDTLMRVDPGFQQLAEMVLGPGVDAAEIHEVVFGKASPDPADSHVHRGLEHRVAQGAAVLGTTAGAAATLEAARSQHLKDTAIGRGARKLVPTGVQRRWGEAMAKPGRAKKLAGAALALQATELAGTGVMGHTLHRQGVAKGRGIELLDAFHGTKGFGENLRSGVKAARTAGISGGRKVYQQGMAATRTAQKEAAQAASAPRAAPKQWKQQDMFHVDPEAGHIKAAPEQWHQGGLFGADLVAHKPPKPGPGVVSNQAAKTIAPLIATPRRVAATAGVGAGTYAVGSRRGRNQAYGDPYAKRDTWTAEGTFSKVDSDKHLAFGWASVVSKNGLPVVDRQDDIIDIDEVEKAAYEYVQRSRIGGDMHRRTPEDTPHRVADMVESFVLTPEKISKMGLPADSPTGWWVGFKIHDEDTWQLVKKGERTGFSIHGRGRRRPVDDVTAYS